MMLFLFLARFLALFAFLRASRICPVTFSGSSLRIGKRRRPFFFPSLTTRGAFIHLTWWKPLIWPWTFRPIDGLLPLLELFRPIYPPGDSCFRSYCSRMPQIKLSSFCTGSLRHPLPAAIPASHAFYLAFFNSLYDSRMPP